MATIQGNALPYVSSGGFIDVPTAHDTLYRKAHKPQTPKPTGLDWDALTPTCSGCKEKSGSIDATGLCATCRGDIQPKEIQANVTSHGANANTTLDGRDVDTKFTPPTQLPEADNQGQPTPGASAPRPEQTRRTKRTARKTGPATPKKGTKKGLLATQETRPAVASRPTTGLNLDAQCDHAARVLRDTAAATNPAVKASRTAAIAALEALHLTHELYGHPQAPQGEDAPVVASTVPVPSKAAENRPSPAPRPAATHTPRVRRPRNGRAFPIAEAQRLYLEDKLTCIEIGERIGFSTVVVRRHLKDAGTTMRDDRTGHSGGRNKILRDPDDLVDDVRRLYEVERLTIDQVAERLGLGRKAISNLMARNSITARPHAFTSAGNPGQNTAGPFREEIAALGVTAADIKTWALRQGLIRQITRGLPTRAVVQAYADAHPQHAA